MKVSSRVAMICALVAIIASSCRATPEITATDTRRTSNSVISRELPTSVDSGPAEPMFADPVDGGGIDYRLERADIDCTDPRLDLATDTPVVAVHMVVNGNLGGLCFGDPDERLVRAWASLAAIAPDGQLHKLAAFSGFESREPDQTTLAFVVELAGTSGGYEMSVNLTEAQLDPDELYLTMAHEFAHVLTTQPDQIDRSVYPKDCDTWHNLRGCYTQDSLMWDWVQLFWDDGRIDRINPKRDPSLEIGQELCVLDPSFLGPYSASHPEEDFAEAFSAFVFRVNPPTWQLEQKMDWFARQPELDAFRTRAIESGLGPLANTFAPCG